MSSVFECRNLHLVPPGRYLCDICGEAVYYVDGRSERGWETQEEINLMREWHAKRGRDYYEEIAEKARIWAREARAEREEERQRRDP